MEGRWPALFKSVIGANPDLIVSTGAQGGMFANRRLIQALAAQYRVPAIYSGDVYVEAGGLMAFGPSTAAAYYRAAYFVDRILKGARPADLPVEQPTKFDLTINLNTAKALGITFPQSILLRADQVIE